MEYIKDFLLMLQFMTRIPIKKNLPCEIKNFRDGSAFFWLVGLFIGVLQYGVFIALELIIPKSAAIAITILFSIIITGGLHVDGLGDTCDGFFAFKGKDKVIEIMKDSRIGTFACIAIVFDILLKYILTSEAAAVNPAAALILPPVIGRASIAFMAFIGKNAKEKGSGNLFIKNVGMIQLIINLVMATAIPLYITGFSGLAVLPAALVVTALFNMLCNEKMGGITGDSFGANNELVELFTLIILCAGI
jgi:adenosylcobinamide-GDP ribazoletransferase